MEENKTVKQKRDNTARNIVLAIIIFIAVTVLAFLQLTNSVNSKIIASNIETMKEIALHDAGSIRNSITLRWDNMEGVAKELSKTAFENDDELFEMLKAKTASIPSAIKTSLLDSENTNYLSNGVVEENSYLAEVCNSRAERFVIRLNTDTHFRENISEVIFLGVPVELSADGRQFEWLICQFPIDTLEKELKITSYDGEGYSSVIDADGNYIINISRDHSFLSYDNFYDDLADAKFEDFRDADELKTFTTTTTTTGAQALTYTQDGEEKIMVVTPFELTDWFLVTTVPTSVFDAQSKSIITSFFILLGFVILFMAGMFFMTLKQRKQQAELEEKNATDALNRKLQEQQIALEEALGYAQSANRAKTTFLNSMSHDIRTPMNAIIGYTGLASSHIDSKELVQDYLRKISQSSEHLLSLINDVLDMSRIESGKVSINEKEEDLSEILHTLRSIVQADVQNKQFDFFMDSDVTNQYVVCDKLRLNQVLLNVLSNSIKYTQAGGTVSVRLKEKGITDTGYGIYEFRIKDNGMGMSEEFLKTIFDPFTRANTSTVSGIQGTGLGMAITKNIIDMMGGRIDISSKEGEGTETVMTFEFKLAEKGEEVQHFAELAGLKSLVVDDDISACRNIAKMLRDTGMQSDWCTSGKEAVIRTEEAMSLGDLFKVYIIDWLMPDMNGIETARRIRQIVGDQAPIIILTAYDWSDVEEEAKEAGVTAFLSKPLFPSDLQNVLNQCCGNLTEEDANEPEYDFAGKKVLLVEDNEMNREIGVEILEEVGLVVDTAEDGTYAVEAVAEKGVDYYDFILMDIQMPIMDGYTATEEIRKLPGGDKLTIIAQSANAFEEDVQKSLDYGMNAHVAKPIDMSILFATMQRLMKK